MAQWHGWRKALTVLGFIAPTLIGILIFNIYPILFNTYISFTNRNMFHPNPDCSVGLTGILEPTCWHVFQKNAPKGLAAPYTLKVPLFGNYIDLLGKFFTGPILLAALRILICFIPLIIAGRVNKHYDQRIDRPFSTWVATLAGILLGVLLAILLDFVGAIHAGDTERGLRAGSAEKQELQGRDLSAAGGQRIAVGEVHHDPQGVAVHHRGVEGHRGPAAVRRPTHETRDCGIEREVGLHRLEPLMIGQAQQNPSRQAAVPLRRVRGERVCQHRHQRGASHSAGA